MQDVRIGAHHWVALPQRALYWPSQGMLLLADLHLGKADTFRHFAIAVPDGVQQRDVMVLQTLLQKLQPQRCVILGDFIHGAVVGEHTRKAWNTLVGTHTGTSFELVMGNHDRAFQKDMLHMHAVHSMLEVDGVYLTHEPMAREELLAQTALNIHGHIHPAVRVAGSRRKLAALVYQAPYLQLPAFSEFTAGVQADPTCDALWVFVPSEDLVMRMR